MKLLLIKIFVFLYLTTSTQFSQLYKVPVFISHFIEHLQKDKLGSVTNEMVYFIEHHYGGHEQDEDWQTDQKLPFIKIEISHVDHSYLPIIVFEVPLLNKTIHQKPISLFYEEYRSSHYLNSIWQPPKQA